MLVYLWHMAPVLLAAIVCYPTTLLPQPRIGSAPWLELRPIWEALLAIILIPLIVGLLRLHRPLLPALPVRIGVARPWPPAILIAGLAAAGFGLTRLAIAGFAPGGSLPALVLAAYACGLLLTLLSGPPALGDRPAQRNPEAATLRAGPTTIASPEQAGLGRAAISIGLRQSQAG